MNHLVKEENTIFQVGFEDGSEYKTVNESRL